MTRRGGVFTKTREERIGGRKLAFLTVLFVGATLIFYYFALHARYAAIDDFVDRKQPMLIMITAVAFTVVYAATLLILLRIVRRLSLPVIIGFSLAAGMILLGKISLLDFRSDDYDIFLGNWIVSYTPMTIWQGFGTYIASDYTPPYLYILVLISRVQEYPSEYLIKAVSVLFDAILAYGLTRLFALKVRRELWQGIFFCLAMILPPVVFNGAYWAQCDVIYVSFCILALAEILSGHPVRGMSCFGVALSFKLQTVFFLPVLLPLWQRKDIKLWHVGMIPLFYMVMMTPALLAGKSLHHVLTVYISQAGTYNFITINGPTLYELLPGDKGNAAYFQMLSGMAMMLAFAFMVAVCAALVMHPERVNAETVLCACVLFTAGIPFFLPKMHERYTFGADVLSFAMVAFGPQYLPAACCLMLSSYLCYTAGLYRTGVLDLSVSTLFAAAGLVIMAIIFWRKLSVKELEVKA